MYCNIKSGLIVLVLSGLNNKNMNIYVLCNLNLFYALIVTKEKLE